MTRARFFGRRSGARLAVGMGACCVAMTGGPARAEDKPIAPVEVRPKSGGASEPTAPLGSGSAAHGEAPRAARQVLLLRTVVLGEGGRKADKGAPGLAAKRAEQLDRILSDAIQDLGLTLDVSDAAADSAELSDLDLLSRVQAERWVVYPSIDPGGPDASVRIAAVAPGAKVVTVRTEIVKASDLPVRAVVMLRDVVAVKPSESAAPEGEPRMVEPKTPTRFAVPARSQGRATLALNAALFGAFVGYSVQRSSGSDDPRLLFPLMALGTGVGLGASAIVAEEWDVGLGDAWYMAAGAWWPALSGWFLARGAGEVPRSTAYGFSVIGAVGGLGLATTALALHGGMSEGGALLAHSGGAFGTVLGALTELAVRGTTEGATPEEGIGFGAAGGVALAGLLATQVDLEPSRVLAIDLGAGLGGLAGAAAASPFIFGERTRTGDRAFLVTTMASTVAGGVLSWFWTRKSAPAKAADPAPAAPPAPSPTLSAPFSSHSPRSRDPLPFTMVPYAGRIPSLERSSTRAAAPPRSDPPSFGLGIVGGF